MARLRMVIDLLAALLTLSALAACATAVPAPNASPFGAPTCQPAAPTAQAGPPPLPLGAATFIDENTGKLCLEPYGGRVRSVWYPYSLTIACSREVQRLGDVRVDEQAHTIRFYARLVYIDPLGPRSNGHTCPAASYDPPVMQFDYLGNDDRERGTYSVWWGGSRIGDVILGQTEAISQTICLFQHK
jgi:hypothetical protein